jgi:hypothetical protein
MNQLPHTRTNMSVTWKFDHRRPGTVVGAIIYISTDHFICSKL